MDALLSALDGFLQNQGTFKGLLILFAVFMVWRNWRQNQERLADKDREIDRLAKDVHDMRDRMMALWDKRNRTGGEDEKEKTR